MPRRWPSCRRVARIGAIASPVCAPRCPSTTEGTGTQGPPRVKSVSLARQLANQNPQPAARAREDAFHGLNPASSRRAIERGIDRLRDEGGRVVRRCWTSTCYWHVGPRSRRPRRARRAGRSAGDGLPVRSHPKRRPAISQPRYPSPMLYAHRLVGSCDARAVSQFWSHHRGILDSRSSVRSRLQPQQVTDARTCWPSRSLMMAICAFDQSDCVDCGSWRNRQLAAWARLREQTQNRPKPLVFGRDFILLRAGEHQRALDLLDRLGTCPVNRIQYGLNVVRQRHAPSTSLRMSRRSAAASSRLSNEAVR